MEEEPEAGVHLVRADEPRAIHLHDVQGIGIGDEYAAAGSLQIAVLQIASVHHRVHGGAVEEAAVLPQVGAVLGGDLHGHTGGGVEMVDLPLPADDGQVDGPQADCEGPCRQRCQG